MSVPERPEFAMSTLAPSLPLIRSTFEDTIAKHGGSVRETFETDDRLIMRATLLRADDVTEGDTVNAGVAIRCAGATLEVHPYVFRQVCRNGQIAAQSVASIRISRCAEWRTSDASDVLIDMVQAVNQCAMGDAFPDSVNEMRAAAVTPGTMDMLLSLLPLLPSLSEHPEITRAIMNQYAAGEDDSVFGILNAITATARDTEDPEMKWSLEELGAGVPAWLLRMPSWDQRQHPVR